MLKTNKQSVMDMGVSVEQTVSDYLIENYNNIPMIKSTDDLRKDLAGWIASLYRMLCHAVLRHGTQMDTKKACSVQPRRLARGTADKTYNAFVDDMTGLNSGKRGNHAA